jgi:FdhE protein
MNKTLEKIKELIEYHKKKNPAYIDVLNFYEKIMEEQDSIRPESDIKPVQIKNDIKPFQMKEGFPLIEKKDFIIDIPSSVQLFELICRIGKNTNETMKNNIQAIEEAITINALNLKELLKGFYDDSLIDRISKEFNIEKTILKFLVHMSIQPSIHANVEILKDHIDFKKWHMGYCPICGSSPDMSELKENGQRYLICSFCDFQWPWERLKCPFCENSDHKKLHYLYAEGQETYRIDLCDKCKQYIKTVDSRKLDHEPCPELEDITTLHLDILASDRGYKKPLPSFWGI